MIGEHSGRRKVVLIASAALAALLIATGVVTWLLWQPERDRISLPRNIVEDTLFSLYGPDPLPEGYRAPNDKAAKQEEAVVFYITNGKNRIAFSEQAKPKDFDFQAFYKRRMTETKTITDTPYESRLGKAEGNLLLSVVADDTWLLITSQNPADEPVLRYIAQHMKRL